MHAGIATITFNQKTPEEIIAIAKEAGLTALEWGAKAHVLPGDIATAEKDAVPGHKGSLRDLFWGFPGRCGGFTVGLVVAVCRYVIARPGHRDKVGGIADLLAPSGGKGIKIFKKFLGSDLHSIAQTPLYDNRYRKKAYR